MGGKQQQILKEKNILPLGKILLSNEHGIFICQVLCSLQVCYQHWDRESMLEERETTVAEIFACRSVKIAHEHNYNQYRQIFYKQSKVFINFPLLPMRKEYLPFHDKEKFSFSLNSFGAILFLCVFVGQVAQNAS